MWYTIFKKDHLKIFRNSLYISASKVRSPVKNILCTCIVMHDLPVFHISLVTVGPNSHILISFAECLFFPPFKLSLKFITNTFKNETAFCFYVLCSFCYVSQIATSAAPLWHCVESDFLRVFSTSLLGQQSGSETSKCKTDDLFPVLLNLRVSHIKYPLFTCLFYTACGEAVFWKSDLRWTGTFCFILDTTKPIK